MRQLNKQQKEQRDKLLKLPVDELFNLASAAVLFIEPKSRSTIYSYADTGRNGVILRTESEGSRIYTCRQWVEEFKTALNQKRSSRTRSGKSHREALQVLQAHGVTVPSKELSHVAADTQSG